MKKEINRIPKRDYNPFFQWVRNRLLGRETETGVRFEQDISDRTQPAPVLPEGPNHKLFENHYYLRDARRMVDHPILITGPEDVKKFPVQESDGKHLTKSLQGFKPGVLYNPPIELVMPIRDPINLEKLKEQKK